MAKKLSPEIMMREDTTIIGRYLPEKKKKEELESVQSSYYYNQFLNIPRPKMKSTRTK